MIKTHADLINYIGLKKTAESLGVTMNTVYKWRSQNKIADKYLVEFLFIRGVKSAGVDYRTIRTLTTGVES